VNLVDAVLGAGGDDQPALLGARGSTSYAELRGLVGRMGTLLADAGVVAGDRVGVAAPNDEAFVVAYLGALHVGAVVVPLNPAAPPAELEREIVAVEPRVVLADGPGIAMCSAAGANVQAIHLDALPAGEATKIDRADDDVAVLLFTSGTAGAPKAAMLTHGNLTANLRQVLDHPGLRLSATDVSLGALPFFHVFGLNVVLGVGLSAGATIVLLDRFDPARAARLISEHGITIVAGVPTMYSAWLALGDDEVDADSFSGVRLAVSGAAALSEEVADGFGERFGIVVHQGYGLTEASPIVTSTAVGTGTPRPGSIGPPLPGVEVRLVDVDGADALLGDPGELLVRGPNVFPGYWHDDEATARALAGGWLHTGDVAVVEESGDLHLVDRAKDLVIVSGFNVYPVEVEDVLREHPSVADAAVVGEPNPRTGEAVVAYVVPAPGGEIDEGALAAHAAHALARYKCPSRYEVVAELPRTLVGKVLRRELRG
jgi:long-chain acyl-CoA synthetase